MYHGYGKKYTIAAVASPIIDNISGRRGRIIKNAQFIIYIYINTRQHDVFGKIWSFLGSGARVYYNNNNMMRNNAYCCIVAYYIVHARGRPVL